MKKLTKEHFRVKSDNEHSTAYNLLIKPKESVVQERDVLWFDNEKNTVRKVTRSEWMRLANAQLKLL